MSRMILIELSSRAIERAGYLPTFMHPDDMRPAKEQIDDAYQHGGGWRSFPGFTFNPADRSLTYPGDPSFSPYLEIHLGDELVLVYPHDWVVILQTDGSWDVSRID
jgi:hypothetical protein